MVLCISYQYWVVVELETELLLIFFVSLGGFLASSWCDHCSTKELTRSLQMENSLIDKPWSGGVIACIHLLRLLLGRTSAIVA